MMEDILDFIKKNYTHNQNIDIRNIEFITNIEQLFRCMQVQIHDIKSDDGDGVSEKII